MKVRDFVTINGKSAHVYLAVTSLLSENL